ncbi:MAG: histidine--tRNA ligase [Chthonomonadales bacterium]
MKYDAPPYMHDVLPYEPSQDSWRHAARWQALESIFRGVCRDFAYKEIRTPVMESTELFTRSVGEGTDIVRKEMFTFEDRGGRSMTLRPEGTAPTIRAYVENHLFQETPVSKLFYISTIYRYEHGQKGRYREHQQTGVEALGSADPSLDAEILAMAIEFYRRIGITNAELKINSVGCPVCRPVYREALTAFAEPLLASMSEDNQERFKSNPLRMLDSKDRNDKSLLANAPRLLDYLCEECSNHFETLKCYLDGMGIVYTIDTSLVRGFDYYTKTAFEIVSRELGAQNSIGGGGRYDGLVEEIGGPPTPGIGFGIGTERCLLVLQQLGITLPLEDASPAAMIAPLVPEARPVGVVLLNRLRQAGISADMDYAGKSLKAQMRQADKVGAKTVIMIGEDELANGKVTIKQMGGDRTQSVVTMEEAAATLAAMGVAN